MTLFARTPGGDLALLGVQDTRAFPYEIWGGDLDGDQDGDIITLNRPSPPTFPTLTVLRGHGDATFDRVDYSAGLVPVDIAVGHVDGDAMLDVLLLCAESAMSAPFLRWWAGTPSGLDARATISMPNGATCFTAADLDGDEDLELIFGTQNPSTLSIRMGLPGGRWDPVTSTTLPSPPTAISAAHLDADGAMDLIVQIDAELRVYLGRGDGTFETPFVEPFPDSGRPLLTGDFDLDGVTDLAHLIAGNAVRLRFGRGDGTFDSHAEFGVDVDEPVMLASGDFDANGRPDLFSAGVQASSMLLNQGELPVDAGPAVLTPPGDARLRAPIVRPSGDGVVVLYDIGALRGRVRLDVFDVRGRRVRNLLDAVTAPGAGRATWDRRDSRGRRVARGVYIVRLDVGDQRAMRKFVLSR